MLKNNTLLLLFFLPVIFYSCEYELDKENFQNLEHPDPNKKYEIILNAENAGETVLIHYDYVKCEFGIPEGTDYSLTVLYDNIEMSYYNNQSYTYIYIPGESGLHTLQVTLKMAANTGSIADLSHKEYIIRQMTWKLKIEPKPLVLNVQYHVLDNGGIELYWDQPDPYYGEVDHYMIGSYYSSEDNHQTDQQSYLINNYLGGYQTYYVTAYFKDEFLNNYGRVWRGSVDVYQDLVIEIEDLGLDSVKIKWSRRGNAVYDVFVNGNLILSNTSDTQVNIQAFLGEYKNINVRVKKTSTDYYGYDYYHSSYVKGSLLISSSSRFWYNKLDNVIYTYALGDLYAYQVPNLKLIKQGRLSGMTNLGNNILAGQSSSKVVAVTGEYAELFSGKELIKESSILIPALRLRRLVAYDDVLQTFCFIYSDWFAGERWNYVVYNVNSGETITSILLDPDLTGLNSDLECLSPKGKYLSVNSNGSFYHYKIENNGYIRISKGKSLYSVIYYNPNNDEELYAQKNSEIDVLNSSDLSLMRTISIPAENIMKGVDSETGNILLLHTDMKVSVISALDGHLILETTVVGSEDVHLMGNVLILGNGCALNLNKYIQP